MGCDGGTIPKRNEIVKNKQKDQARDKDAELAAKWQFCALSGLPLRRPIVACALGRLYNKIAIVEHLLEQKPTSKHSADSQVSHIRTLRDVKELKLSDSKEAKADSKASLSNGKDQLRSSFVCPISGLDLNGKYKFFYSLQCGCVFSERALKQVPNDKQCILCSRKYEPELDLIVLNGDESETRELRARLEKLARRKLESRRQQQACCGVSSSTSGASTSSSQKVSRPEVESTSKKRRKVTA